MIMSNYNNKGKGAKTIQVASKAMREGTGPQNRKRSFLPNNDIAKSKGVFAPYDASVWDDVINYPVPTLGPGYYNGIYQEKVQNYIPNSSASLVIEKDSSNAAALSTNPPILMHFHFVPTMGANTNDNQDPLNLVAEVVYRYISNVQRGGAIVTKYNRLDVLIYLFCISQIIMMCRWFEMIVKCGCSQMTTNNTMPLAYFKAIDLTTVDHTGSAMDAFNEMAENIEAVRSKVKMLNTRLATLILPNGLPIMEQWTNLLQTFYADSENTDVAQLYSFSPDAYFIYEERIYTPDADPDAPGVWTGAKAKYMSIGNTIMSWKDVYDIINSMIDAMVTSSDVVFQIGSDIQTAYGTDDFWHPEIYVPEEDTVGTNWKPVYYDPEVLSGIRNAKIFPRLKSWDYSIQIDPKDYTKPIKLWGRPQIDLTDFGVDQGACAINAPLQFHQKPTKQQQANALKWHPIVSFIQVDDTEGSNTPCADFGSSYGTELLSRATIVWKDPTVGGLANSTVYSAEYTHQHLNNVQKAIVFSDFAEAPLLFDCAIWTDGDVRAVKVIYYTGDREYEVPISYEQAQKYFTGFTRFAWGAEQNASSKGLYSASQRKQIG
jgi:hypothetical protein